MLTQQNIYNFSDINPTYKTVSIVNVTIILNDNVEIARSSNTMAFAPGQIEAVKSFIGVTSSPEIDYLNAIWTQDVINAYIASQSVIV